MTKKDGAPSETAEVPYLSALRCVGSLRELSRSITIAESLYSRQRKSILVRYRSLTTIAATVGRGTLSSPGVPGRCTQMSFDVPYHIGACKRRMRIHCTLLDEAKAKG